MTSREAFEAWLANPKEPFFGDDIIRQAYWEAWSAAWKARGKHDAEVCRNLEHYTFVHEECAQAIESDYKLGFNDTQG